MKTYLVSSSVMTSVTLAEGSPSLTSITIPDSVTSIGKSAFSGCTGLKTAGPIGSGSNYEFGWQTSIPANAFSGCTGLTSITIPEGVTSIGQKAFCELSGQNKTAVVERAVQKYPEENLEKMREFSKEL